MKFSESECEHGYNFFEDCDMCDRHYDNESLNEDIVKHVEDHLTLIESERAADELKLVVEFEPKLRTLLNCHSIDNMCNIPDFILASHLTNYIRILSSAMRDTKASGGWLEVKNDLK